MAEESWNAARLIPTSGINGADEQERRATSALLAVLSAVSEFGRTILTPLGAPAGKVETYIEVPFELGDRRLYPDGLIRVSRGQRVWTILVEVKTGTNDLEASQIEAYLDIAREQGFDAVLTISNQIPAIRGQHPVAVDRRKVKKVALYHLPWVEILAAAVMQKEYRGVADPDQAWILGELIRYLEHPRSGAMAFEDMGAAWVPIREAVHAGTLRPADKGIQEVAARFDALLRYVGLRLGQRLGLEVQPALSRRELAEPELRTQSLVLSLSSTGTLSGGIRIPGAASTMWITADLRAGQVLCACEIEAPKQGRPRTRVLWLTRQLDNATESLRIEAFTLHSRGPGAAELLRTVRTNPDLLIGDPARELKSFRITQIAAMGTKRGTGRGAFIDSVIDAVDVFYSDVMRGLRTWSAPAPRLREEPDTAGEPDALVSTALSSQDEPDTSEEAPPTDYTPSAARHLSLDEGTALNESVAVSTVSSEDISELGARELMDVSTFEPPADEASGVDESEDVDSDQAITAETTWRPFAAPPAPWRADSRF